MDQKFSEFSHTHICFYTQQVILNGVSPKWIKIFCEFSDFGDSDELGSI